MQELKERTAAQHRSLEAGSGTWEALRSRPAYGKLLTAFYGIYRGLESQLAELDDLPHWIPDLAERWKLPALIADLATLSVVAEDDLRRTGIPDIRTTAAGFGCLYVMEGSTLGGQFISREVRTQLGLTAERGCRFFSSYGANVGQRWKAFGEAAGAFCEANEGSRGEVVESAVRTFEYFSRELSSRQK